MLKMMLISLWATSNIVMYLMLKKIIVVHLGAQCVLYLLPNARYKLHAEFCSHISEHSAVIHSWNMQHFRSTLFVIWSSHSAILHFQYYFSAAICDFWLSSCAQAAELVVKQPLRSTLRHTDSALSEVISKPASDAHEWWMETLCGLIFRNRNELVIHEGFINCFWQ